MLFLRERCRKACDLARPQCGVILFRVLLENLDVVVAFWRWRIRLRNLRLQLVAQVPYGFNGMLGSRIALITNHPLTHMEWIENGVTPDPIPLGLDKGVFPAVELEIRPNRFESTPIGAVKRLPERRHKIIIGIKDHDLFIDLVDRASHHIEAGVFA